MVGRARYSRPTEDRNISLVVEEPMSARRRDLLRRDPAIVTWGASQIECASALNRLHRENAIDSAGLGQSLERLRGFAETWLEVRPMQRVRNRSLRLRRIHSLLSADAMQLAAALVASGEDPLTLDLVCSDARLSAAASQEGITIL